jgi:hypothetical protein
MFKWLHPRVVCSPQKNKQEKIPSDIKHKIMWRIIDKDLLGFVRAIAVMCLR